MSKKINSNLHKFMALPATILFLLFFIYPLCRGVGFSMMKYNGISAPTFIGLGNFISFFKDTRALGDVRTTLLFGLCSAVLLNVFGLFYALIFEQESFLKRFGRTVVYIPAVISGLIMGYVWLMILSPETGTYYRLLQNAHALFLYFDFLGSMKYAIWLTVIVYSWQLVGGPMIIYLAGLQSIDVQIYESSKIDGANYFQNLFRITLPLLIPSIKINVIVNIIGGFAIFDVIAALTSGGPGFATESLSMFIYQNTYGGSTGYATAVSIIMFFIVLIPVAISLTILNKKENKM
jgi:raffinose/stachyose/melibiose transport system permease protein